MGLPAIRNIDLHVCPNHGAEKIGAVAQMDITVNGEAALHVGHGFTCGGEPTKVASGSTTVRFHGEFAARALDDSGHQGKLVIGSGNVVIGGPTGVGCMGAGNKGCHAMSAGRKSGKTSQSYGNCALESVRQILRQAKGADVGEEELLNYALQKNLSTNNPGKDDHGATPWRSSIQLLSEFGVESEIGPNPPPVDPLHLKQALLERKGIIAQVNTRQLWQDPDGDPHAVLVTAVECDERGNVVAVFINDTGLGTCGQRLPIGVFLAAMRAEAGSPLITTKGAIW